MCGSACSHHFVEVDVLLAVMNDEEPKAFRLLAAMSNRERRLLARAARDLALYADDVSSSDAPVSDDSENDHVT